LLDSVQDTKALGSLILARIVYAVNWLNVGAIFYLMSSDLGSGVSGLGTLTASFYLGIGVMQVPGGLLAAKWGPKRVVVTGVFLSSLSALGTSVLSTIPEIAVLRFLVGTGMAFVFAPGVVLVADLLRGGRSGIGVGLFNSAFDLGGLIGIFGWILLASATGWRPSIALSGGLGVFTGLLVAFFVPNDAHDAEFRVDRRSLFAILRHRQLGLLGLGTLGFGISNTIISGFMVYYLEKTLSVPGPVAGIVTSLILVVPIFTALWGGRIYDKVSRHRMVMILALLGSSAALWVAVFPSLYAAAACSAIGGVVSGVGYTFAFAGARDLNNAGKEYESLAIAWVNSISLTGSFLPPIFFSYVAERLGYSQAWFWSAVVTLAFLLPIVLMAEKWRR
jgi:MFS transporter, ACS family, glucarate transporter